MGTWSLPPTEEHAQAAERFAWPPRMPSEAAPVETDRPAAPQRRPLPVQRDAAPVAPPKSIAEHWLDIERAWLDMVAPPLADRMKLEGWSPDSPAEYCSRCALSVGRDDLRDDLCRACHADETTRPPWRRIVRLGAYEHPLDQWIREVKFTRWRRLGHDLGRLLGDVLAPELAAARESKSVPEGPPLVVPVPMPAVRRLIRGIDHSTVVARGVASRLGGRVVQPLRRDLRPSQTRVAPSSREANVANSIHARHPWVRPRLGGSLVIVVDDVTTTTSTLRGACRAVAAVQRSERDAARSKGANQRNPGPIWAAVLARTGQESHDFLDGGIG